MEILEQILVSLLGMALYTLFTVRSYLKLKEAKTKIFWFSVWVDIRLQLLYTVVSIIIISITIKVLPPAAETIEAFTGFNVAGNLMSFFSLGLGILASLDSDKKPQINLKNNG